ncbi:hypothetical protein SLU01_35310 [Sporosarcina luteola]|uniref:Uncharacterized protein n=1 Tax=Sporosarcina luteola TaxID=582850 RepID=A0A511ZCP1_9BACL|nr:Cthe_2314 family HEPN domain-containing protein [Sporosarcina luteola]GEN85219.1 hypothetical protein SLU01_35310 [Sporosarcina luteola]
MDDPLLDEHMEKMKPYLMKWHREHSVMLLTSPYITLHYEVVMEGFAPPKDMLCQSYLYSITEAFRELVRTHYYAQAAYQIEIELREKGDVGWSNYWKFEVKNYYFRMVIPRIISLLDYVAVMINELSGCELVKDEWKVYFNPLKSLLRKQKQEVGWLSLKEIEELNLILSPIYKDISREDRKILNRYRNTATHRYFVGIDELTVSFQRRKLSEIDQRMLNTQQTHSYGMRGRPEYTFDELNTTAEKLLSNLDGVLSKLMQMHMMKRSVKQMEE